MKEENKPNGKGKPCPNCGEMVGKYWIKKHGICPKCKLPMAKTQ